VLSEVAEAPAYRAWLRLFGRSDAAARGLGGADAGDGQGGAPLAPRRPADGGADGTPVVVPAIPVAWQRLRHHVTLRACTTFSATRPSTRCRIPDNASRRACGGSSTWPAVMNSQMEDKNTLAARFASSTVHRDPGPNAQRTPILLNQRLFVADTPPRPRRQPLMDILTPVTDVFHADPHRSH